MGVGVHVGGTAVAVRVGSGVKDGWGVAEGSEVGVEDSCGVAVGTAVAAAIGAAGLADT